MFNCNHLGILVHCSLLTPRPIPHSPCPRDYYSRATDFSVRNRKWESTLSTHPTHSTQPLQVLKQIVWDAIPPVTQCKKSKVRMSQISRSWPLRQFDIIKRWPAVLTRFPKFYELSVLCYPLSVKKIVCDIHSFGFYCKGMWCDWGDVRTSNELSVSWEPKV